ncbi:MAG TPA: helix-turn-helix domain-containing protein [Nocardioidaceae bacterium]|nr:helix-turn-helix domain-containing protein [Nocardioidaceae bacterium]
MPDGAQETDQQFAALLRRLRERAGLSQQELADRAGLTPHAISALERGTRTRPYPHTVRSLAEALEVSPTERDALIAAVPRRQSEPTTSRPTVADRVQRPSGLVVPPTLLYGRENDLVEVAALVRDDGSRLVTLTGPGGVGKTRLAAALSETLAADFPDGVVQVSLAPLADASDVVATIGRALGVVGIDGPDAFDVTVDHVGGSRLLLVLDNFEHLLSAAPHVARLTSLCPSLTVLVSSRSPLRVRGEREYAVEPLGLPRTNPTTPEQLAEAPAGALLLDRARALTPRLELSPGELSALAVLCHRLSGLPLAIELASAQLRLLTPEMLLERLDVIGAAAGDRDLPERQRTMRATLDWSYRLLGAEQQELFRILGVFRGGAALRDVEDVAARAGLVDAGSVLSLLGDLVEQSLVVVRVGVDGQARYDMLEPVAQYARGLLLGEEAARASRAHAAVFVEQAEQAAIGYENADQVTWLASTEAQEPNLLVAIDRSLDVGDASTAVRITWALWLYWWLRGKANVGRRRAELCLAHDLPPRLASRARLAAATMSYAAGDLEASAEHWAEALRLGRLEDDAEVISKAGAGVGLAALASDDIPTAVTRFREALEEGVRAEEAGVWLRSLAHVWLGTVQLLQGQHDSAVAEIERGHALARARGDRLSTYIALYNLSQAAITTGDHAAARRHLLEGIELSEQTRDMANLAYFLEALAVVESAQQLERRVGILLGAAATLRESVGSNVYSYYRPDESLRDEAERRARSVLGAVEYDEAVECGSRMDVPLMIRFALDSTA